MFKNEPLWAVYAVLKQHYSHLAGGKTNKAFKLTLKKTKHHYCCPAILLQVAVSCIIYSNKLHAILYQVCMQSDKIYCKMEAFY